MSGVLVDTDILIEVLRHRDESIVARWRELSAGDEGIVYSPVTAAELWHGLRPREEDGVNRLLNALICVPVDGETGRLAGTYLKKYHASHSLALGDALIAATASIRDFALWTRNWKHYPMREIRRF